MEEKRESNLVSEPVGKLLFKLALPAVTAQIVNVLYNMVDRMYIGHIPDTGALALTGVGVCMPLIMLVSAFASLVSMGGAPRSSVLMGAGRKEEAEKVLGNCVSLLILISALLTALLLLFSRRILLSFGASENTIGYAMEYMMIYAAGTIFVQISLGLNTFITAQGFAKISMFTVLIGAGLNIVLDPVFIFALGMGVRGAALATVLSQAVSALWVTRFLTGKNTILRIQKDKLRLEARVILPCLALGLSPFVMQSTESLIAICFNASLLRYGGDLAVGAMTILNTVMQFSMLPIIGMAQGAQPITGYNFGAGNGERVKAAFFLLLKSALIYSMCLWLLVMLAPKLFILIFTNETELIDYTVWALRVFMASSGIFGAQLACQQTFIAIGNAKTSLFLAVLRKIILLIPLIYILPMFVENKILGVFLAEPAADFLAVVTTVTVFYFQFGKALKQLKRKTTEE